MDHNEFQQMAYEIALETPMDDSYLDIDFYFILYEFILYCLDSYPDIEGVKKYKYYN